MIRHPERLFLSRTFHGDMRLLWRERWQFIGGVLLCVVLIFGPVACTSIFGG